MLISEITLGEMVYAYNEETDEIGLYPVTDYFIHEDPVIVYLTIDGELIETTPEHPFYTAEGAWVDAGDLQPGDQIRTRAWTLGTVDAIKILDQTQLMYNFTVATAHTYFIGDGEWLVHNTNICPKIAGTRGLAHSFSRHAHEWFGRTTLEVDRITWQNLIEKAVSSKKIVDWSTGGSDTIGYLARIEGKYFFVQVYKDGPRAGELATAFIPSQNQLSGIFNKLN